MAVLSGAETYIGLFADGTWTFYSEQGAGGMEKIGGVVCGMAVQGFD
jgi:hypothetical protein